MLLGSLQSDAIESRFGWLRQLAGANYYISMRQVMEGDNKIRALSLLKFSGLTLPEIDDAVQHLQSSEAPESCDDMPDSLPFSIAQSLTYSHMPSSTEVNIIYYVSGYIARSVVHTTRCEHCRMALVERDDLQPLEIDESLDVQSSTLLDSINRGGLSKPTEYTLMTVVSCWRVYQEIKLAPDLFSKILSAKSQRLLFTTVMDVATTDGGDQFAADNFCLKNHSLKPLIAQRFFNCVAKNLVREMTQAANVHVPSKKRKIAKLQSTARV